MYKSNNATTVDLKLDLEEVLININQALPVGLLLNEILNNAFKHAFVGRGEGEIQIKLSETDDKVQLVVKDNGVGFSSEEESSSSLGHTLIDTFIKQLRATVDFNTDNGTHYTIEFEKQNLKGTMASNMNLGYD
ncbi:MAG: sensor histidine kinase [Gracilimonas sp.]|nr:sensor histidine kinase [Gracilimonas sp.]